MGELYLTEAEFGLQRGQIDLAAAYFDSARMGLEIIFLEEGAGPTSLAPPVPSSCPGPRVRGVGDER